MTPEEEFAELELEESRILRELSALDEKTKPRAPASTTTSDTPPVSTLNQLLAECEEEVREAKGYIASSNPPLRIARCRRGEGVPPHATYLSRPKGTGVDFTVPVALKEYNATVKNPIFLNSIRDKCAANKYRSPDEYVADMKLLWKNTAAFNKGAGLEWVVQHAKLLHECAEEAVARRRRAINDAMSALGMPRNNDRKRKRGTSEANGASLSNLTVGMNIQIYWEDDRRWHTAKVLQKSESQAQIQYENDPNNSEWLDMVREAKWRLPTSRGSRRIESANKRKKSSTPAGGSSNGVVVGVGKEELAALKDELVALIEDSKMAVLNTVRERYAVIENKLNRSDALHRVLIAVNDVQDTFHGKFGIMQKNMEQLQVAVSQLVACVGKGASPSNQQENIGGAANDRGNAQNEEVERTDPSVEDKNGDTGKDSVSEEAGGKDGDEMDIDVDESQNREPAKASSKDSASENENGSKRDGIGTEAETTKGENAAANGCTVNTEENEEVQKADAEAEGEKEKETGGTTDEQVASIEEDINKKLRASLSDEPEATEVTGTDTGTSAVAAEVDGAAEADAVVATAVPAEVSSTIEKEGNDKKEEMKGSTGSGFEKEEEKRSGSGGDDGGDSDSDGSSSGSGESDSQSDAGQDEGGKVKNLTSDVNMDSKDSSDDMRDSS